MAKLPPGCAFCKHWLGDEDQHRAVGWCLLPGNDDAKTVEPVHGRGKMTDAGLVTWPQSWCAAFKQMEPEDI